MTCVDCEIRRAKLLVTTRAVFGITDPEVLVEEMRQRWPHRFYLEHDGETVRIMRTNTIPPYQPFLISEHTPDG